MVTSVENWTIELSREGTGVAGEVGVGVGVVVISVWVQVTSAVAST